MENNAYPHMLVVPADQFNEFIARLESVEKQVHQQSIDNQFKTRVLSIAKGGCLTSSDVQTLMDWSYTTFWRRVSGGELPMTKDGNRWKIDVDSFLQWHQNYFLTA